MFNESRGLRATQKEATGKAVLEAARAEFERVGFDNANVRAIAARAGVSPGTVIHHYGDKKVLLHAALFDDLEDALQRALTGIKPGPLTAQLSHLTREMFGYYQARPKLSRTLLRESLFAEDPWAKRFTGQVARVHGVIVKLGAEAVSRGELKKDADLPLLGAAWFSFFYFALLSWVQGANPSPVPMVEHLLQQHLEGLTPPKPKQQKRRSKR